MPAHVVTFLTDQIDSVIELELLLLLHGQPERGWSAAEAGRELRVDPTWAAGQMQQLCDRGLLRREEGVEPKYKYGAVTRALARVVDDVANVYAQRRVTVISLVYSKPVDPVRRLAEAFRIRTPREEPPHG